MPTPNADGPDIAHYQVVTGPPHPNWKLYSLKCSEGANSGDKTFAERWTWLRTQPSILYRGAYHWLRSDSTVAAQAQNIYRRITALGGLLPGEFIQNDWETTPNIPNMHPAQVIEFNDRIRQLFGRDCVITYASDWVPGFYAWREKCPDDPLWYANYNISDKATGGWKECAKYGADVWQWTSSYYQDDSIRSRSGGGFDMNHVFNWDTLTRISGFRGHLPIDPPPTEIDMSKTHIHNGIRIFDTRDTSGKLTWAITNPHGYTPKDAVGVMLNITILDADADGFATFYGPDPAPAVAQVNFVRGGGPVNSFTMVPLDENGQFKLKLTVPAHIIIDQVGLVER